MGRQAHLTRLALGRSPYGEPLRDENGDFIMGSHAHIYGDVDYKQQWDARGHPRNPATILAERRLRRAQNSVLAAVGVVTREDRSNKTDWANMEAREKTKRIRRENEEGRELRVADRALGVLVPWAVTSLRSRILTYRPYHAISTTTLVWLEWNLMGPRRILSAGLPLFSLCSLFRLYRQYFRDPDVEDVVDYTSQTTLHQNLRDNDTIILACCHAIALLVEIPVQVFSTLHVLGAMKPDTWLNWTSVIPFTETSPILPTFATTIAKTIGTISTHVATMQFPNFTDYAQKFSVNSIRAYATTWGPGMAIGYATRVLSTPLVLFLIRDYLQNEIGFRLYACLRQFLVKPVYPDKISAKTADNMDVIDDTSIPGIGHRRRTRDDNHSGRFFGPQTFMGALRKAFPILYNLLNLLSGRRIAASNGCLRSDYARQIPQRIKSVYQMRCDFSPSGSSFDSFANAYLRREVMYTVFSSYNLDPDEELVDPGAWIDAILNKYDQQLRSTSLSPKAESLMNMLEFLQESEQQVIAEQTETIVAENQAENQTLDEVHQAQVAIEQATTYPVNLNTVDETAGMRPGATSRIDYRNVHIPVTFNGVDNHIINDVSLIPIQTSNINAQGEISLEVGSYNPSGDSASDALNSITIPAIPEVQRQWLEAVQAYQDDMQDINFSSLDQTAFLSRTGRDDSQQPPPSPTPPPPETTTPNTDPPTPQPGISRAASIMELQHPPPQPNRTTDIDQAIREIDESLFAPTSSNSSAFSSRAARHATASRRYNTRALTRRLNGRQHTAIEPASKREHRVTALSTFAADSLAWHTSAIITNIILLPLEALYLRSLTHWLLTTPGLSAYIDDTSGPLGRTMGMVFLGGRGQQIDVLGFNEWFGGESSGTGKMKYIGSIMLTFGIEALIRGVLWHAGTKLSVRKGLIEFGWGKF